MSKLDDEIRAYKFVRREIARRDAEFYRQLKEALFGIFYCFAICVLVVLIVMRLI